MYSFQHYIPDTDDGIDCSTPGPPVTMNEKTMNDNDNEKTFIAKVVQRKSVNHTSTQLNLKDSSCQ